MRYLWAALAALFLFLPLAGSEETLGFVVAAKTWVEVPEEYQVAHPRYDYVVGTWQSRDRHKQKNLYIHTVSRMGWKYSIKDTYGRQYVLYSGKQWTWSPGDIIVITGQVMDSKVFIPQGERVYGR